MGKPSTSRQPKQNNLSDTDKAELIHFFAEFTHDPAGFVWAAFPWGEGELEGQQPQEWQEKLLDDVGKGLKSIDEVVQETVASGNGIGKSSLVSWLIIWSMATFEDTKGVVTANTDTQLRTKTWAELAKWHRLFIGHDLFVYTATSYYSSDRDHEKTWRIDAIPWSDSNPESFAGLHNQSKRILLIFDEASAISDVIWETAEGALTDKNTEIIWCAFGNPTRNSGRFYECFNKYRNIWHGTQIDSRTVAISNKSLLQKWIDTYGEDSDFVRVHVKGSFPHTSTGQLIGSELVTGAIERYKTLQEGSYNFAPVIFGVDNAWTGEDQMVAYLRQGIYSKVLLVIPFNDDDSYIAGKLAVLQDDYNMAKGFIDQGYGTGIYSCLKSMGRGDKWELVPFAGKPNDDYYANKRAEIWSETKKWLKEGGCLEDIQDISVDLTSPEAFINRKGKLQLESKDDMKARGLASPNYGDALALTFAQPVIVGGVNSKIASMRKRGKMRRYGSL